MSAQDKNPTTEPGELGFMDTSNFFDGLAEVEAAPDRAEKLAAYGERLKERLHDDIYKGVYYLAGGEFIGIDDEHTELTTFYGQIDDVDVDYFGQQPWLVIRMSNLDEAEAKSLVISSQPEKEATLLRDHTTQEAIDYSEWQETIDKYPDELERFLWAVSAEFKRAALDAETTKQLASLEEAILMEYGIALADQVVVQGSFARSAHGAKTIPQGQISNEERSTNMGTFLGFTIYEMPKNQILNNMLCVAIKGTDGNIILQPCSGLRLFTLESL